jgi:SagB-type dehydrogenase family enzyme
MAMSEKSGEVFQRQTRHQRGHLAAWWPDWATMPETYKRYVGAPQIALDQPETKGGMPLWSALQQRHSERGFSGEPVTMAELSQLLWAMQGITRITQGYAFRTAPSAGALYPIETYVIAHQVQGLRAGVYHYAIEAHALDELESGDLRAQAARAALDQRMVATSDVVFAWTAVFARSVWKYGQRAYRYIYLDAGHIAQNLALAAVSLGLGSCQIAALYDDEVNQLLGVDGESESVLYMSIVGRPEK